MMKKAERNFYLKNVFVGIIVMLFFSVLLLIANEISEGLPPFQLYFFGFTLSTATGIYVHLKTKIEIDNFKKELTKI